MWLCSSKALFMDTEIWLSYNLHKCLKMFLFCLFWFPFHLKPLKNIKTFLTLPDVHKQGQMWPNGHSLLAWNTWYPLAVSLNAFFLFAYTFRVPPILLLSLFITHCIIKSLHSLRSQFKSILRKLSIYEIIYRLISKKDILNVKFSSHFCTQMFILRISINRAEAHSGPNTLLACSLLMPIQESFF